MWIASIAGAMLTGCSRAGCDRREAPGPSVELPPSKEIEIQEVDFEAGPAGPQKAVVIVPRWGAPTDKYPLLVALHGRGESNHGLGIGAWGWVHDYWLDRAILKLRKPPLDQASLLGLTNEAQLKRLNEAIAAKPFRGLVVACPYTPDILGNSDLATSEPFAAFVEQQLIPKMRSSYPVEATRAATGIDGVSLGGRMALLAGCSRPKLFGAIGTLQAAVRRGEVDAFASRAKQAIEAAGGPLPIRLLTSEDDPFRPTLQALASAMSAQGTKADFQVVPGPHDYAFNRGPGSYEMLLWHDRVLRGEPPP